MSNFLKLAKDRYSARKFKEGSIPEDDINAIIESGLCAPTAVNKQPFRIWAFHSEQAREKLLSCTKMQFISPAEVIFMIGAKADEAWVRPFDEKNFAEIDASIVTTQMMLQIHDLGYGSTWIGHFDEGKVKELFPDAAGYELIALLPVGIIAEDCEPSPRHSQRRSIEDIVEFL